MERSPFGGIPRNWKLESHLATSVRWGVPPSGGSLEIGNSTFSIVQSMLLIKFPLRGDP